MDVRFAAKFPFLKASVEYLKDQGITLEKLVSGMAFEAARLRGKERVMDVLEGNVIRDRPMAKETDATNELLSYPVARMIVSAVSDPAFVKRYAIAEAKRARRFLKEVDLTTLASISEELGLKFSREDGQLAVDFTDFLRYTSWLRSKEWKLINQRVVKGRVLLPEYKVTRLIESLLTEKISSELPLPVNDEIINAFSDAIAEIREVLEEERKNRQSEDIGRLTITRFPPCMRKLLVMMKQGENVPHSGRFALVAFLHALGMESEDILRVFSTAPDFDEGKAMYQIKHITGESSGTEYTAPECSTMKSYGICFDPDDMCKRVNHPLSYYRMKGRRLKSSEGTSRSSKPAGRR
ncbi:MAG: DNA primase large subunit PriL [Thermoplasmata archaeon]